MWETRGLLKVIEHELYYELWLDKKITFANWFANWSARDKIFAHKCCFSTPPTVEREVEIETSSFSVVPANFKNPAGSLTYDGVRLKELSELEKLKEKIKALETELASQKNENKDLKQELSDLKKAHEDLLPTQLSFWRQQNPDLFTELEKRIERTANADDFIRFVLWKEQKARFEKQEVEQQKDKQIKEKRKVYSKLQKHNQNIKNLVASREELTKKYNREKASYQEKEIIYQNQLSQITSSQEVNNFHQQTIKEEMGQIKKQKNDVGKLNIVWAVLFISSLLTTVFLSIKMKTKKMLGSVRGRGNRK